MKVQWKKTLALVLSVTLMGSLITGCGGGKKDAAGGAAKQEVITLKYNHLNPTTAYLNTMGHEPWAKTIEEQTGGKVKVQLYPGETLSKSSDAWDSVTSGLADIAVVLLAQVPNRFKMTEVMYLPMLGIKSSAQGTKVIMDLYNNTPYLKKELTGVKVLSIFTTDGFQLATKKPVTKIEDINGMKLRAPGGNVLAFMKSLGASPVSIPIGGVYQAMEKGICEGNLTPYEAHEQINTQELTKYVLDCNVAQSTFMVIMNQKKYDSLPADVKKVIDANSGLAGALTYTDAFDTTTAKIKDKFTKAGVKITEMTPEEEAKWIAAAKPIQDKWVADMTAQGYPAKEVLAKTKELVEKYKGQ